MTISLIGTGNVATSLCPALLKAGHDVQQLSGRMFAPSEVMGDIVIICVKDDAIPTIAALFSDSPRLIVHTAGSIPSDVIPAKRRGVFYPMQTFSRERIVDFSEVPLFIESSSDIFLLRELAHSISNHVYQLDSNGRRHLHLAAVFASNFVNHCYTLADDILREQGIPFSVLLPLIDEVARKVHVLPPLAAQTGPAKREDTGVLEQQASMLTGRRKTLYQLMSQSIQEAELSKDKNSLIP